MEYTVRSWDEIEDLKAQWRNNPHWDIELTPGFEAWHDELKAFGDAVRANWQAAYISRITFRAVTLGIPGNLALVEYLEALEARIHRIEIACIDAGMG